LADRDYFTDHSILTDPYAYFEAVRARGPVYRLEGSGIVVVTGFDEVVEVLKNAHDFSSANSVQGAATKLPFTPQGADITPQIEAHRTEFVGGDLLVAYDDRQHSFSRSLLNRLFTPSRLRANEEFIAKLADDMARDAAARGGCDLIRGIATPFATLVIADLLGVPADDRQVFMDAIEAGPPPGSLNSDDLMAQNQPLVLMGMYFVQYVLARRENPTQDVLSELANATYPDGSTPDPLEIVRLATFLFGAGQDTSAKLLGNALRYIVEQPGLQQQLRETPALIPQLIEEVLRLEGSAKMTSRLARRDTRIGDMEIPAGTQVMLALAAGNRDPRRWEDPDKFDTERAKAKEHLAFGRGAHVCAGAALARVEVRVMLEKLFEHSVDIDIDEAKHGPRGNRSLDYEPSFIIRGLTELHLKLTPVPGAVVSRAETAARPAPAAEPAQHYSTAETKIGTLLAHPSAKAVLDRHFPGMSADPRISMASGMTLRMVQKFAPDGMSEAALDAADAELAGLEA